MRNCIYLQFTQRLIFDEEIMQSLPSVKKKCKIWYLEDTVTKRNCWGKEFTMNDNSSRLIYVSLSSQKTKMETCHAFIKVRWDHDKENAMSTSLDRSPKSQMYPKVSKNSKDSKVSKASKALHVSKSIINLRSLTNLQNVYRLKRLEILNKT